MAQTLKKQIFYYILYLCSFLSLIAIRDTGGGMFVLLVVLPMCATILGIIYGLKQGFFFYYNLIIGFLTASILCFWFYQMGTQQVDSILIYTGIYMALSFVGNSVGFWLRKLGQK